MFESMVSFVMTEHLWGQSFEPPIGTAGYVRLMAKHRRPYKTRDGSISPCCPTGTTTGALLHTGWADLSWRKTSASSTWQPASRISMSPTGDR